MSDKLRKSRSLHGGRSSATAAAFLGAIFIHPVAFALAWVKGLVLGSQTLMAPTPNIQHGIEGAFGGIAELLFLYVVTFGVAPLLISLVGAGCGVILARRFSAEPAGSSALATTKQPDASSPVWLTAMWASSLTIAQTLIQKLVLVLVGPGTWGVLSTIIYGLHLGIWGVGIAVAFWVHRDLRVVAYLVGFAITLPVVFTFIGPWLPPFSLLALSIGVLFFCLYKRSGGWAKKN